MRKKKKVAFYIESMIVGGAEKVLIDLVNNLNPKKYEVTVIALFKKSVYSDYCFQFENGFHPHVKYKYLIDNTNTFIYRFFNYLSANLGQSTMYRFLIREVYDVEIAFYEGWPTEFVSSSSQNSYKIAWLHTDQFRLYHNVTPDVRNKRKQMYKTYGQIVGVSEAVCDSFISIFPDIKPGCLYNPVNDELISLKAKEEEIRRSKPLQFVSVGRLISIKGYERLISCLARCKQEGYSFALWIIGDGEDKEKLKALVKDFYLEQEIIFFGQKSNPYPYIKAADCLICSSYAEGLSTVVIEAITLGTPVITTNCSGMKEIFGASKCGIICENSEEGLLISILEVLHNTNHLVEYHRHTMERREFFTLKNRMADIETMLDRDFTYSYNYKI